MIKRLTPGQLSYLAEVANGLGEFPPNGEGIYRSDGLEAILVICLDGEVVGRFTQEESSWLFEITDY